MNSNFYNIIFLRKQLVSLFFTTLFLFLYLIPAIAQQGLHPEQVAEIKNVTSAMISSDGNHVAYTVSVPADPKEENSPNRTHLYVLNTETGDSRPYYSTTSASSVSFRPEHDSITFLTQRDDDSTRSLYELPLHGGEAVKLLSQKTNIVTYEWAGDGNHVAFTAPEELPEPETKLPYSPEIFEENTANRRAFLTNVRRTGHEPHPINVDGTVYMMAWSPDDSQLAISAAPTPAIDDFYMFQKVFIVDYGSREVVAEINNEGKIGQIVWSPDGERIPVITMVHGGPEAHYSNGWLTNYSMPGQMAAAKGYGVFYPNYRGSTGRGVEFVHSSQGGAAAEEFDDIVDGIDYLIDTGVADENRIGVTGGSYGGYASAWMSTYYSDRFAASVMFVGISNNISKWGTSDIPEELYLVHARERIWEDNWEKYLENSPIYWVDRAQTPILIMHGAEDTRVHPAQSMELYRHLKVRKPDLPVRLVFYPGEGHGNVNSTSRYDYTLRMFRWFDTYLMTGDASADVPHWEVGNS